MTCQSCSSIKHPLQSQSFTCQCCCSIKHPLQSCSLTCQSCSSIKPPLQSQSFTCQSCCSIKHPLQSYSVTAGHCHCHSHQIWIDRSLPESPTCRSPAPCFPVAALPVAGPKDPSPIFAIGCGCGERGDCSSSRGFFFKLPQPKEATKKAPKKVRQVKKKCLDGRKRSCRPLRHLTCPHCGGPGPNNHCSWCGSLVCQSCINVLDLCVQCWFFPEEGAMPAPSPILVIDLSELLFHQAPSPILVIVEPGDDDDDEPGDGGPQGEGGLQG